MTKTDIERILEDPELHPDFRKDLELQLSEIINNENFEKLYGNKINSIKDIIENSEAKNKVCSGSRLSIYISRIRLEVFASKRI